MGFNWLDYLALSERLQSDPAILGLPEASLRSATSRAYYAAFQHAMSLAKKEGFLPKNSGEDHKEVPKYFRDCKPPNQARRKIAVELDRLRDQRRLCDYDDDLARDANVLAQLAIGTARGIVANVDSLMPK